MDLPRVVPVTPGTLIWPPSMSHSIFLTLSPTLMLPLMINEHENSLRSFFSIISFPLFFLRFYPTHTLIFNTIDLYSSNPTTYARSANGIVNPRQDQLPQEPPPPPYQNPILRSALRSGQASAPTSSTSSHNIGTSPTTTATQLRNGSNNHNSNDNHRISTNSSSVDAPPPAYNPLHSPTVIASGVYMVSGHHTLDRRANPLAPPKPPSPTEYFGQHREMPKALKWRNGAQTEYDDRY